MDEKQLRSLIRYQNNVYRHKHQNTILERVPILAFTTARGLFGQRAIPFTSSAEPYIIPIQPTSNIYFMMMPEQEWAREKLTDLVIDWEDKVNDKHSLFREEIQYPLMVNSDGEVSLSSGTHVPTLRIPTQKEYLSRLEEFKKRFIREEKRDMQEVLADFRKQYDQFDTSNKSNNLEMGDGLEIFRQILWEHSYFTNLKNAFDEQPDRV